ncbi:ABC transporter permease, partial [Streptomyces sp. ME01-24h]|nr:ABC transporter permease [Streptomyces sp. ME01-24h]
MLAAPGAASDTPEAAPGARQLWRRLRAQRAALAGVAVIALLVLVALTAP